jgi:molecular chaperone DnaK
MEQATETVWGIDLGTTYSCIARVDENGYPIVVNNQNGDPITPSVVMFNGPDDHLVGADAKANLQLEPDSVCALVKQNMGNAEWRFRAAGEEWSAAQVSSLILKAIAEDAQQLSGIPVEKVVITVPAYFGVTEREATIAAGKMAGLEVVDILNEPTAAAFSYGFGQGADADETVLVYDLGGGTFDVTVIRLESGDGQNGIRVVATGGDDHLGGAQWDERMVSLLAEKFQAELPDAPDPLDDDLAVGDLRIKAEDAKRALTSRESVKQIVQAGADRTSIEVTRDEFERATADLLDQTIDFTKTTVAKAAEAGTPTIDRVLLVGGSSFMPAVKRRLMEEFPDWNPELQDPNQAVAKGAGLFGLQAGLISMLETVAASTNGNGNGNGHAEVTEEQIREVAVAAGLSRDSVASVLNTSVTNVCSRAFGIKSLRAGVDPGTENPADFEVVHLIAPNTPLPIDGSLPDRAQTFQTVVDGQSMVRICIMEQESQEPTDTMAGNRMLEEGEFQMTRAYPASSPVRIELGMNESGTIDLKAVDPDGREMQFAALAAGAVIPEEQIEAGAAKVAAMRRG